MNKNIAVLLCGSGARDGSEIRESVGVLWALSKHGLTAQCIAPDGPQADVVNMLTGEPAAESRSMIVEAARIARGDVVSLIDVDVSAHAALVIPGGFGVAKNLCTFASRGSQASVRPDVATFIQAFAVAGKPIGAVCIAPALVALALKGLSLSLTLGGPGETAQEIEKLGHKHVVCGANQCHVDNKHRLVSTPAYMHDGAPLSAIFTGIEALVVAIKGMLA